MRGRRLTGGLGTGVAVLAAVLAAAPPPAHAAPQVTLALELDDAPGSTVAADGSGLGHHGAVGSHVRLTGTSAVIDRHPPGELIWYGADHLITVADAPDGSLDPGPGNFTVEFRFRSTVKFGNVVQKGQARTAGGQVKFQQPQGYMSCMFKSPTGRASVKAATYTSDGLWHVIRCERTPAEVRLYVDGVLDKRIRKSTGTIDNAKPWTIGGKLDCDTSNPETGADSCDYFAGEIDWMRFTRG